MPELLVMGDHPGPVLNHETPAISLDTETTGLTWEDRLLGVSMAWKEGEELKSCYLMDPRGSSQLPMWGVVGTVQSGDLADSLLFPQTVSLANHSFDFRFLFKHIDLQPLPNVLDVQHVARHMGVQENGLSLAALYTKYVGKMADGVAEMKEHRGSLSKIDVETVANYAREDALMTFKLDEALRRNAGIGLYKKFHYHDQRFMHLVMKMVKRGVPLDLPHIKGRIVSYRKRMMEIQTQLIRFGIKNANSTKDIGGYCRANNIPVQTTGADDLALWADQYPALAMVTEFKSLDKAIGSWLEPLSENGAWDGNLHSQLNPFGTKSYRMSAGDPNAQGIPMEERGHRAFGSMFGVFKSDDPEYELWGADLKQAEMRLAAVLSGDIDLQYTISQDGDIYKNLAMLIWGDEKKRQTAKQAQLSAMYEVGAKTFSMACNISIKEAKDILQKVRSKFPTALRTSKSLTSMMEITKKVDLVTGRPRWMTKMEIDEDRYYVAFNQRVQGSLAELMDNAMLLVEDAIPGKMVLQVHDSIVIKINKDPEKKKQDFETIRGCMEEAVKNTLSEYRRLPMPIDFKPYQVIEQ